MNRLTLMMATALSDMDKANAAGVETLVASHSEGDRQTVIVRFPGGHIAEIHAPAGR